MAYFAALTIAGITLALLIAILVLVVIAYRKLKNKHDCQSYGSYGSYGADPSSSDSIINPVTDSPIFNLNRVCPCNDGAVFGQMQLTLVNQTGIQIDISTFLTNFAISALAFEIAPSVSGLPVNISTSCLNPTGFTNQFVFACPTGPTSVSEVVPLPTTITGTTAVVAVWVTLSDVLTCTGASHILLQIQGGDYAPGCTSCPGTNQESCNSATSTFVTVTMPTIGSGSSTSSSSSS